MSTGLAFGPLRYAVDGPLPAFLVPYAVPRGEGDLPLSIQVGAVASSHATVWGTGVSLAHGHRVIHLPAGSDPERSLHAPLAALAARDLPSVGALLLHASAVRGPRGAVLLVGPPSVGKTTFARHDPTRALAGNAVCAWRAEGGWVCAALPFASDPDPRLDAPGTHALGTIVELHRATTPWFEWQPPSRATVTLMKRVAVPSLDDPWKKARASCVLDLAAAVALASLGVTGSRTDLDHLDRCLNPSARP
ncbi:MAG: hypothetical protein U0325_03670 [Polyangiales bacterium]